MQAILTLSILIICLCAEAGPKRHGHKHKQGLGVTLTGAKCMALKSNLLAYWNFEQDPRLFPIHDQSGNGNHLIGHNSPTIVAGKVGNAIQFNGTNQWLDMASSAGISHQGTEFTAFIWFKVLALAHNKNIVNNSEWGASTVLSGGSHYVNVAVEDEDFNITDVPLEVGRWYFLALGWYGANGQFAWGSINLSDRVRESQSSLTAIPNSTFNVGGNPSSGWNNIVIDEAAIWRRAVSAEELTEIYNDGDGLDFSEWDAVRTCKEIKCCDD